MSGICGIFNPNGADDADRTAIRAMLDCIKHRGPNGLDFHEDRFTLLGAARFDGSDRQPARAPDSNVWALCDGDIHNAPELRSELSGKGFSFETPCDAGMLSAAYLHYGDQFVHKLRGMYAVVVWDAAQGRLFLARDRSGKKPLFHTRAEGRFIFASEIKALLQHPLVDRRPDIHALHHLLSFQHAPGEDSLIRNISKLPPAHSMVVGADEAPPRRYWMPENIRIEKPFLAVRDANKLFDLLKTSVRRRMPTEGPVGVFLSGGLESSAVTGLAAELAGSRVHTFSLGFDDPALDETHYARMVARHFGTTHTDFKVTNEELMESVPLLVWHNDAPITEPLALPLYWLAKNARPHISTAMCGLGADELFGGHDRYVLDNYLHYYNYIPESVRRGFLGPTLNYASNTMTAGPGRSRVEDMAALSPLSDAERHLYWLSGFTHADKMLIFHPDIAHELRNHNSGELLQWAYARTESHGRGFTEQQLLVDFMNYLPETELSSADRAAMSCGLELRCPFLSKKIIELALSLPSGMKIKGTTTKRILKKTLWNFLPTEILYRPKQGFQPPLGAWFRGPLRDVSHDYLTDVRAGSRGLFNDAYVRRLLSEHSSQFRDHGRKLWALLNIEFWFRIFIDGSPGTVPATRL